MTRSTWVTSYNVNLNSCACLPANAAPAEETQPHLHSSFPSHLAALHLMLSPKVSKNISLRSSLAFFYSNFCSEELNFIYDRLCPWGFPFLYSDYQWLQIPLSVTSDMFPPALASPLAVPSPLPLSCILYTPVVLSRLLRWLCISHHFLLVLLSLTVFHMYVNQINIWLTFYQTLAIVQVNFLFVLFKITLCLLIIGGVPLCPCGIRRQLGGVRSLFYCESLGKEHRSSSWWHAPPPIKFSHQPQGSCF